jgi:hypothetical protein
MSDDKARDEFVEALRRLPRPISCFSNGAACPWCGALHATVTFGPNSCVECERPFYFGYPEWHSGKDPVSWVHFPYKEFEALGGRASVLAAWQPNDLLKQHYFQKSEEQLGVSADRSNPN